MRSLLIIALLCLSACSRSQLEVAADTRAGAVAYQAETDPAKRAVIADGIAAGVIATTENLPGLPEPEMTPDEIRSDPSSYRDDMMDAKEDPPAYEPPPSGERPADQLTDIGNTMTFWGGWAGALSVLLLLVGLTPWGAWLRFPAILGIIRLGASLGTGSAIIGSGMVWLAPYWWAVVALVALGIGFYHRKGLMKYWNKLVRGA